MSTSPAVAARVKGYRQVTMMTRDEALTVVRAALRRIARDADVDGIPGDADLREHLDMDSIDFLAFADELEQRTGVAIAERDYPELASVDGCVAYVVARSG